MSSTGHEGRGALPVGTVLRDFTVQGVIGHGGFGVVYLAGHNELDLTVAIKEYLPVELAVREGATVRPRNSTVRRDFEDGLRRFRDEAQVLVGFESHPSVISCRDFYRANGTAYLVMAYEDGQSLEEVLARREAQGRPFTERDLLAVMRPVLEGLARVHAAGVLHRDIKPSNILIRRWDERPVLIDFGAAKQAAARFSKSQAPYTEGYAALEQVADAGQLGPWTDMYGAGAVMWRMVAGGNRPWEPPHPVRVELRSHAAVGATEDPMPSASELGKGRFPPRLLAAIDRCLRLREAERLQDSRELLEVLRAPSGQPPSVVSGKVSRTPPGERAVADGQEGVLSPAPVLPEPRKRLSMVGGLVLTSLVIGLGLTLATWWGSGFEQTTQDPTPIEVLDVPGTGGRPENDDRPEARPKPWVRDWDKLGGIREPGFAEAAQAYIARYGSVSEAKDWVARVAKLLDMLAELEAEDRRQEEERDSWKNVLGIEFVWISDGSFLMGSPEDEDGRYRNERQHEVRISTGFWMQKYEVTQGDWELVMGTNPSHFSDCGPQCPVESVSWENVQAFIRELNERESGSGYEYRLPTEAEWEYAARANTVQVRHGELDSIAWYGANSDRRTHPVGQKQSNAWGLHDMLGNVSEWTEDWYGEFTSGSVTNPKGPGLGSYRVSRGGGWGDVERGVRSATRGYGAIDSRSSSFGFRLVRTK